MPATLELKYFNTFWLKKIKPIVDVTPNTVAAANTAVFASQVGAVITITASKTLTELNVGQEVSWLGITGTAYVIALSNSSGANTEFTLNTTQTIPASSVLTFGEIINFDNIPKAYLDQNHSSVNDWYLEESRIRGGYNNLTVDFGVKAYTVEEDINQRNRFNSLIYSGVFNSRTGVNETNEFSVGEDITRSLDPAYNSIQKLYAEDTNLIIFQEDKVSRALIDKDAIYSAEGNAVVTSTPLVIGQIVAFAGEYGISTDPFSFAVYGYRKYFTDRKRGVVLRLSKDGITEISSYGMHDYFRDMLTQTNITKIVGGWDSHSKDYVISIQGDSSTTVSFDEGVLGWTSFFNYVPSFLTSLSSTFYTFKDNGLWKHHTLNPTYPNQYCNFYGFTQKATVTLVLNGQPSLIKNFKTINYEGGTEWFMGFLQGSTIASGVTPTDALSDVVTKALPVGKFVQATSLGGLQNQLFANNFKRKENKYFATLVNDTQKPIAGEIFYGQDTSGIEGFFAVVRMELVNNPNGGTTNGIGKKELFAVSTEYVESSY
tara:strand:+ start:2943 stop:4574 length:1632 start_codon:yes stop_codon:yes gene_type:complete